MDITVPAPEGDEDEEDLTREAYARFGLAYYFAECVHRSLVNAFAIPSDAVAHVTRPRSKSARRRPRR